MGNRLIQLLHRHATDLLPAFHTSRVHNLDRVPFYRVEHPGTVRIELFRISFSNAIHDVVIVSEQHIEAFIELRCVGKLLMRMSRQQSGNGSVEGRGVSHLTVEIPCCKSTRNGANRPGSGDFRAPHDSLVPLHLRSQFASDIDLRACNVAMHVNAAWHHNITIRVKHTVRTSGRIRGCIHDPAVIDPDVANLIVNPVLGINNAAADDLKE